MNADTEMTHLKTHRLVCDGKILPQRADATRHAIVAGPLHQIRSFVQHHARTMTQWLTLRSASSVEDVMGMGRNAVDVFFTAGASPNLIREFTHRFIGYQVLVLAPSLGAAKVYARLKGIRQERVLWGDRDLPIEHLHCEAYELVKMDGWERDKSREYRERVETWGMSLEEARWHLRYGKSLTADLRG